jgi:imidazolonepropionase-like amidohydrolase
MRRAFMNLTLETKIFLLAIILLFCLPVMVLGSSTDNHQQKIIALKGGTLIDGYNGKPINNSVILIQGKRIKQVGTVATITIPEKAEIISTEGMSVLPGLWDAHVHLMINGHADYIHWDKTYPPLFRSTIMPSSAQQLLMAGVTSARDLGAPLEDIIAIRDAINAGKIPGPTLYVCGPFLQHRPYPGTDHFRWGIKSPEDARQKVKKLVKAGVDFIKLIDQDQMTLDEIKALVDESHKHGLKVVAHAHRPEEIRKGLIAGVDCFEHTGLSNAPEYPEDIMKQITERTAKMNLGPLFWCPTVSPLYNYTYFRDNLELLDNPACYLGLPENIKKDIRDSFKHPDRLPYYQMTPSRIPTLPKKFSQLKNSGLVLLVGTDSGIPMTFHAQSTWYELEIWVNILGVDPIEAIRAATYWPAVCVDAEKDSGTVSEGKFADIVAVKGDVLRNISLLSRIDLIIKHGHRYK